MMQRTVADHYTFSTPTLFSGNFLCVAAVATGSAVNEAMALDRRLAAGLVIMPLAACSMMLGWALWQQWKSKPLTAELDRNQGLLAQ